MTTHTKNAVAVRAHVLDKITCSGTEEMKMKYFFKNFVAEYGYQANFDRYKSLQNVIANYLQGLPSVIDVEYTYHEIDKLLIEWGYIEENTSGKALDKWRGQYWDMLAMALIVNGRRAGVKGVPGMDNQPKWK